MTWYKILLGALAVIGGAAWYLKKKIPITFETFCEECIDKANKDNANHNSQEVVKTIVVLTCENDKNVMPYIYRRYANGGVKKKKINSEPFPMELCPDNVKDAINKGEYVLRTI